MENTKKTITEEMKQALLAPLPDEAISQHPTKTFLSTIKAIYVTERLNNVFGVGAWKIKTDFVDKQDKMIVVKCVFEIPEYDIYYECFGGNDNQDTGDAYKGATTDAITKIGSYLGIGIDVFKGKHTPNNNNNEQKKSFSFSEIDACKTKEDLIRCYEEVQKLGEKAKQAGMNKLTYKKKQLGYE